MRKQYLRVFSFVTAVNLLLVLHIETSGNLREGWQQNYVKGFQWWDMILFLILFLVLYGGTMVFVEKVFPKVQCAFHNYGIKQNSWSKRSVFWCTFFFLFAIWFFFFLVSTEERQHTAEDLQATRGHSSVDRKGEQHKCTKTDDQSK